MAPTSASGIVGETVCSTASCRRSTSTRACSSSPATASVPLLERVRFCSIFSSHLDEFFMVRVAGLRGLEDAGVGARSPDGRTPSEVLAEIRERALDLTAEQSRLWKRELRPALERGGHRRRAGRGLRRERARGAEEPVRAPGLSRADAARRRPGPAVPVHLRPLAEPRPLRPRSEDGRGAVRAREGAGAPAAVPAASASAASTSRSRA